MKFVIVCLLVGVAFAHNVYENLNALEAKYGPLKFSSNMNRGVQCNGQQSEPVCGDTHEECNKFFICLPGGAVLEGACNETHTCNDGKCTDIPNALCEYNGVQFKCAQEGVYPDPSSCKKYNYCLPATAPALPAVTRAECEGNWAYNPVTTLCDKPLLSKICTPADKVVPKCRNAGQTEALKASASYYYVCAKDTSVKPEVVYPNIYRCPNNQKYVGNFICK